MRRALTADATPTATPRSDDELAALVRAAGAGVGGAGAGGAAAVGGAGGSQAPQLGGAGGAACPAVAGFGGGDDWMSDFAFAASREPSARAAAAAAAAQPAQPPQPPQPQPAAPALWEAAPGAQVKFHDSRPEEMPQVLSSFFSTWMDSAVALGYIQPGCTLLTVTALRPIGAPAMHVDGGAASGGEAAALAGALLAAAPEALRGRRMTVRCASDGTAAAVAADGATTQLPLCAPLATAPQALPRLAPRALCTSEASEARSTQAAQCAGLLAARFHGHALTALTDAGGAASSGRVRVERGARLALALPACGLEGAMTLSLEDGDDKDADAADAAASAVPLLPHALCRSRPVLLTPHAGVAAEVASLRADAAGGDGDEAAEAEADALILTLGAALRPRAPPALIAAAAAAAALRRWPHTLQRLLEKLADAAEEAGENDDAPAALVREERTVLHAAAAGGCARCVAMVLRAAEHGGPATTLLGIPSGRDASDGATPLHLAAAGGGIEALRALAAACPAAPLVFFGARDAAGATPANALPSAPAEAAEEAAVFRAAMRDALGAGIAAAQAAMATASGSAALAHEALMETSGEDEAAATAAEFLRFAFRIPADAAAVAAQPRPEAGRSGASVDDVALASGLPGVAEVAAARRSRSHSTPARGRAGTRAASAPAEAPATVTPADGGATRTRRTRAAPAPRRAVFPAPPAKDA